MRQLSVIVLIALVATSMAQMQNCSQLPVPTTNFYNIPMACKNETSFVACETTYQACLVPHMTAGTCPSGCATAYLRCIEAAAPSAGTCDSTWSGAFNNEKLYLAAGGDYNGSALMMSCNSAICGWMMTAGKNCTMGTEKTICADPSFSQTTQAPTTPTDTTVAPTAKPGRVTATFKFSGTPAEWNAAIAALGQAGVIAKIVNPLLKSILGTDAFVVTGVTVGSLQVDFYMTNDQSAAEIQAKLESGTIDTTDPAVAAALAEAKAAGVSSDIGVVPGSVTTATQAPNPPPPGSSASAVAVIAAVLAVVSAMLF